MLGLLAREPCSGYDLIRRMEEPVGFFWHARRSQIYPELARLEAAGLLRRTVVAQQDRPDKKVYEITRDGLAALRRWIAAPTKPMLDRDEFMLKVYSSWLVSPEQALALIREHEARHTSRLARYEEIEARMEPGWAPSERRPDTPKFAAYATLRRGIEYERGYVEWCRWLASMIAAASEEEQ